ncbi:hypothetical protein CH063_11015, partial [Colletotrichum higginsianum]
ADLREPFVADNVRMSANYGENLVFKIEACQITSWLQWILQDSGIIHLSDEGAASTG